MNIVTYLNDNKLYVKFGEHNSINVLNKSALIQLNSILDEVENNGSIKVVIFFGEGKCFIAGADIKEMSEMNSIQAKEFSLLGSKVFDRIETIEKFFIAGINGYAFGGGNELSMACDYRFASKTASFSQPEIDLALIPGFSGIQRMIKIIGENKAKDLIFTGRRINAEEALNIGLVNKVCDFDSLLDDCNKYADLIISKQFSTINTLKRYFKKVRNSSFQSELNLQSEYFSDCFNNDDVEKLKSFLNKKK